MSAPASLRAGDSAAWTETLPDYPASDGWFVVVRILRTAGAVVEIESEALGDDHVIAISAADSAEWAAGAATLVRVVKRPTGPDTEEVKTLSAGSLQILPNLSTAANYDARTDNERALADAEAALADYLKSGRGHIASYGVNGRQFTFRSVDELRALVEHYKREVAAERAIKAALSGHAPGRIFTRF